MILIILYDIIYLYTRTYIHTRTHAHTHTHTGEPVIVDSRATVVKGQQFLLHLPRHQSKHDVCAMRAIGKPANEARTWRHSALSRFSKIWLSRRAQNRSHMTETRKSWMSATCDHRQQGMTTVAHWDGRKAPHKASPWSSSADPPLPSRYRFSARTVGSHMKSTTWAPNTQSPKHVRHNISSTEQEPPVHSRAGRRVVASTATTNASTRPSRRQRGFPDIGGARASKDLEEGEINVLRALLVSVVVVTTVVLCHLRLPQSECIHLQRLADGAGRH